MALLTLTNAHLAFGHVALLDGADFALETGERVALIGRNGTGKSTLFRAIAGDLAPGRIKALRLPTLILWGGKDRLVPPANAERFHADIPGSQLVVFPGLGHVPHEEDAATTVVPIRTFLGLDAAAAQAAEPAAAPVAAPAAASGAAAASTIAP